MKGIVLEYDKKDVIILTDDGLFKKIRNNNYSIGQRIEIEGLQKGKRFVAGIVSMAAALILTTVGSIAYYTPTDYISLDVNPSIEYTLNTFDRILDVEAINKDGETILSGLKLNHMSIDDAVKITLDELIFEGYLTGTPDSGVVITASNKKMENAEAMAAKLEQEVKDYLAKKERVAAEVKAEAVGKEKVQEAKKLGVTPGKLKMVEKLQSSTSGSINRDEWLHKSIKEINSAIKENSKYDRGINRNKDWDKIKDKDRIKEKDKIKENKNLITDKGKKNIEKARNNDLKNSKNKQKDKEKSKEKNNANFKHKNKNKNNTIDKVREKWVNIGIDKKKDKDDYRTHIHDTNWKTRSKDNSNSRGDDISDKGKDIRNNKRYWNSLVNSN
jgi:hypothetical protein